MKNNYRRIIRENNNPFLLKKLLFATIFAIVIFSAKGQQFSFQMFFRDAADNRDTITLGYDTTATDSIDASFSEVNIISVPLNNGLDVRITNEWRNRWSYKSPGTFHTKKQITYYACKPFAHSLQTIDIFTKYWPVTVSWNKNLFTDSCRYGSVFTSVNPGGWWDTGSPSNLWRKGLRWNDSVTFTTNIITTDGFPNLFGYINSNGDTIPVFWQAFGDTTVLWTGVFEWKTNNSRIAVFPNPATDYLNISLNKSSANIHRVEIFNLFGEVVFTSGQLINLYIAKLSAGFYIVKLTNEDGSFMSSKFQKINIQ